MENRVVVTGLGIISPNGNDVSSFWKSMKEGIGGVGPLTSFDPAKFDSRIAAEVKGFDPALYGMNSKDIKRMDKFAQYAVAASKQAIDSASLDLDKENRERIGVIVGSGIGSLYTIEEQHKIMLNRGPDKMSPFLIPMLIVNEASGQVGINFGLKGPNTCVATACASG